MNPKNRRLRRSVAAAGTSLLGIGMAASYLVLGVSAPAQAGTHHILQIYLKFDSGSVLVQGTDSTPGVPGTELGNTFCVRGPLPKGWLRTPYQLLNGTMVKVLVFGSPDCTDRFSYELDGTVPDDDGNLYYWLQ